MLSLAAAMFGMFFFLTLFVQDVLGYSPLQAGFAFLPAALATLIGSIVGTRIVTRLGTRRQLVIGPLTTAAAVAWLAQLSAGDGYLVHVFGPLTLAGIGLGLSFVPMTIAATADVPTHQAGLASGLLEHHPPARRGGRPGRHGHHRRQGDDTDGRLRPRVLDQRRRPDDRGRSSPHAAGHAQLRTAHHQPRRDRRARRAGRGIGQRDRQ